MKKLFIIFALTLIVQQSVFAQCNVGSYTVIGNQTITGSCKISGDLTLPNGTTLNVDLTGATADTFVVRGNILLQGNAVLWVHSTIGSTNDQFIVSNNTNNQRTITTQNTSKIQLEHVEFRTQEGNLTGASSIYMNYNAEDSSIFYVNKSWLNNQTAWLLFNMKNKATLIGYEPNHVPTEMYLEDSVQVELHGANTNTGIWLNCQGITDTLNLPPNQTMPFTWKIGRGVGGFASPWYLEMDTVLSGVGVQIFPSTKLTINGAGFPNTGELKVAMMFANNTETITNLTVGLQNTTVMNGPNGKVTLNNVNLGPIAWQLYALMNENLTIINSVVNEIGIAGPSQVIVESSLLQLAVLAAVGIGGSTMTINNSEIWNQEITATNSSDVVLNNCSVYGSMFSTSDGLSNITVNGGCFFANPTGCTQATMVNVTTGQPYCNPFIPPGFPQNLTPTTVTFVGVNSNCITGINETENIRDVTIFPNPAKNSVQVNLPYPNQKFSIEVYSPLGQLLVNTTDKTIIDIVNFTSGIYILTLRQENYIWTTKLVKE
jgi:carbonic anhydrase/acetyltransferase-like protein (isoleucine patch superfamily)